MLISRLFQYLSRKNLFLQNNFVKEIVSGGQTGVDRAALDIAIKFKILHSGWCPFGRKAEDGVIPAKYNLKEAPRAISDEDLIDPLAIYNIRTEFNVRDSDSTLIIVKDPPIGGTLYTLEMTKKHNKPCLVFNLSDNIEVIDIVNWIIKNNIHKLNVAGPRASQTADIYNSATNVLDQLLSHPLLCQNNSVKQIPKAKL